LKTIHDIAAELGVSARTVSRVINNRSGVNAETRERVQSYVEKVGFVPNSGARALRTNDMQCIGLAIASPMEEVPLSPNTLSTLFNALYEIFGSRGEFVTFDFNPDGGTVPRDYARGVWQRRYSALVVAGAVRPDDPVLPRLHESGLPYIALLTSDSCPEANVAASDFKEATRSCAAALIARGHRRIGMLAGMMNYQPGLDRVRGLRQACEEGGVPFDESLIRPVPIQPGALSQAAGELFSDSSVTAVVDCSGFEDGAAITEAAQQAGRTIGENLDLSVWSYTDGRMVLPQAVTHYYVPTVESAMYGMQHLSRVYYDKADPACHELFPGRPYTPTTNGSTRQGGPFFDTHRHE